MSTKHGGYSIGIIDRLSSNRKPYKYTRHNSANTCVTRTLQNCCRTPSQILQDVLLLEYPTRTH
uniref:Putative ovule protein n=1 Tax=Solanum chacoense TaxID=4108 RepID=A0A0V0GYJ9_SOLCH